MNDAQMLAAMIDLPVPDLLQASKIGDPLGSDVFYSARTVAKVMGLHAEKIEELSTLNSRLTHIATTPFRFSVTAPGDYEAFIKLEKGKDRFVIERMR